MSILYQVLPSMLHTWHRHSLLSWRHVSLSKLSPGNVTIHYWIIQNRLKSVAVSLNLSFNEVASLVTTDFQGQLVKLKRIHHPLQVSNIGSCFTCTALQSMQAQIVLIKFHFSDDQLTIKTYIPLYIYGRVDPCFISFLESLTDSQLLQKFCHLKITM